MRWLCVVLSCALVVEVSVHEEGHDKKVSNDDGCPSRVIYVAVEVGHRAVDEKPQVGAKA